MCNFISWIEKDGLFLHLDDSKVFSKEGRKLQKICKDNDLLGHGAIRQYYADLDVKPLRGGKDCEVDDFWNTRELPPELAKKVENFQQHWGKMFAAGLFSGSVLREWICKAPAAWKALAWEQLLKQGPDNWDLCDIIYCGPEKYQALAWEQLLKREPSNFVLCCIIKEGPAEYQALAWEQLLKQKPSDWDLRWIINEGLAEYAEKAQKMLNERNK